MEKKNISKGIRILIIYNPKAGKGDLLRNMPEVRAMFKKAGLAPSFYATKKKGDAYEMAYRYVKKFGSPGYLNENAGNSGTNTDIKTVHRRHRLYIIAAGGDGTINEVMRGVMATGADVPIGVLPTGSTNDFGYSLGIGGGIIHETDKIISAILHDRTVKCDTTDFNGKHLTYTAAFGLFSDVSFTTPQKLKNTFGHLAYIMYGAVTLLKNKKIHVDIKYLTDTKKGKVWKEIDTDLLLGMVVSSKSVGGFRGITGNEVKLDDGRDELLFVKWPKNPDMFFKTLIHAVDLLEKKPDAIKAAGDLSIDYGIKIVHVLDARFEFDKPVSWSTDGEYGGRYRDVCVHTEKKAVTYLI